MMYVFCRPRCGIIFDISTKMIRIIIGSDYAIMETRLPSKIGMAHRTDAFGGYGFKLIDDGAQ